MRSRPTGAPFEETSITSPGFLPLASSEATAATARWAAWTKIRSMSGLATSWSATIVPALDASHCMAGGARFLHRRHQSIEIDGGENDRSRLQVDDVVHLALLHIGLVVGIECHRLIADVLQELLEGLDRLGLEFIEKGWDHVIDLALRLGKGGRNERYGGDGQSAQ